jgi:hypothetical protein
MLASGAPATTVAPLAKTDQPNWSATAPSVDVIFVCWVQRGRKAAKTVACAEADKLAPPGSDATAVGNTTNSDMEVRAITVKRINVLMWNPPLRYPAVHLRFAKT